MAEIHADDPLFEVIGVPREGVTHWGLSRLDRGKPERLEYTNAVGLSQKEWPIDDLTYDTIRARWAGGEYKIFWFESEPDHEDVAKRWRSGGHSRQFKIAPEQSAPVRAPGVASPAAPAVPSSLEGVNLAMQILEMIERRASSNFDAAERRAAATPPAAPANAEALAQIAELRADLRARDEREALERRHRADRERLERELAEARREAEEEPDEPAIVAPDGAGFLGQIGAGIANAMVEAAKKNPELVMGVLGSIAAPIIAKMGIAEAAATNATPPPTSNAPPKQVAPTPPTAPAIEPMTSNGMPSVPMTSSTQAAPAPSAAPAAVAAVVETTRSGVPVQRAARANGSNGAAKPTPPAVIDVPGEEVRS